MEKETSIMTTPMPIPHVRPQRPEHEDLHVEVEKPIDRVTFIREQSALFFHDLLHTMTQICPGDMVKLAEECINTAEYIWEESKRITR